MVKQADHAWGSGFVKQLSRDLVREFPEVTGFSERNVKYIRQWYEFWVGAAIGQRPLRNSGNRPLPNCPSSHR